MAKTVIVVIDGFGVGAMPDAGALRPGDLSADTCGHVLDHARTAFGRPCGCRFSGLWDSGSSIRIRIWRAARICPWPREGPPSAIRARTPSPATRP